MACTFLAENSRTPATRTLVVRAHGSSGPGVAGERTAGPSPEGARSCRLRKSSSCRRRRSSCCWRICSCRRWSSRNSPGAGAARAAAQGRKLGPKSQKSGKIRPKKGNMGSKTRRMAALFTVADQKSQAKKLPCFFSCYRREA